MLGKVLTAAVRLDALTEFSPAIVESPESPSRGGGRDGTETELQMEPFTKALETVAQVMRNGLATHTDTECMQRSSEYRLSRAKEHLRLLDEGTSNRTMRRMRPRGC